MNKFLGMLILATIAMIYFQVYQREVQLSGLQTATQNLPPKITDHRGEAGNLVKTGITLRDDKQDNEAALAKFSLAVQLSANSKEPLGESEAITEIGKTHLKQKEYEKALGKFQDALKIFDDKAIDDRNRWQGQWSNHLLIAEVKYSQGQKGEARSHIEQALAVDERDRFLTCRLAEYEKWMTSLHSNQEEEKEKELALEFFKRQQLRLTKNQFQWEKAPETLTEGEQLLIYNVMKDRTRLWIVSHKAPLKLLEVPKLPVSKPSPKPISETDLKALVENFNGSLENSKKLKKTGRSLYQSLFNSVFSESSKSSANKRKGNGKSANASPADQSRSPVTLYIVSTGILNQLDFEKLIKTVGNQQIEVKQQKGSENNSSCPPQ